MRSIKEGKSRVTILTLMPICDRSCEIIVAICSRDLFPALVMSVNSTRFPVESSNALFSRRNPALASRRRAPAESYLGIGSEELNQNWFAGETGPNAGWAWPPKTIRDKSARLMAMEMALRNSVVRNQFFLNVDNGADGT